MHNLFRYQIISCSHNESPFQSDVVQLISISGSGVVCKTYNTILSASLHVARSSNVFTYFQYPRSSLLRKVNVFTPIVQNRASRLVADYIPSLPDLFHRFSCREIKARERFSSINIQFSNRQSHSNNWNEDELKWKKYRASCSVLTKKLLLSPTLITANFTLDYDNFPTLKILQKFNLQVRELGKYSNLWMDSYF